VGASLLAMAVFQSAAMSTVRSQSPAGLAPTVFCAASYFDLVVQIMRRAQCPGIAEQKQIAHQFLEYHRLTGTQAVEVQVTLILQFVQGFLFQHCTDFPGFPMQDSEVRVWAIQPGVDQISHGLISIEGSNENNSYS
jgi:hypothetical protein